MARLQFGKDSFGKEILELVPARAASPIASSSGSETDRTVRQVIEEAGETEACLPYKGDNTIVMMEWERPYMRALVDALGITEESDVLEIGFGCGYSADRIQELAPRTHTIMEPDPVVLARLRDWAEKRKGVRIVEGFWQTTLPTLGIYDAVFFDDFPLPNTPDSSDLRGPASRWHACIDLCVAHHLPIGGRITGYLARPLSLTRPGCSVAPLLPFPVDVPGNCPYFPYGEAYIPLITRTERTGRGFGEENGAPPPEDPNSSVPARKRQKRLVLEALVRDSLGLGEGYEE